LFFFISYYSATINEEYKLEKQLADLRGRTIGEGYIMKAKFSERENDEAF
jgi:hypothetical protein